MYLRKITRKKDGKVHAYWALVESYRTARGPRQRIVAYLGEMDACGNIDVAAAEDVHDARERPPSETVQALWKEVDINGVRTERGREFGAVWLGLEILKRLGLIDFFREVLPHGKEDIPWAEMATILVLARFCHPSSELYIAEHFYARTALSDLLGVPAIKVNDDRLYRALDQLLPHKDALESYLKERMGGLFGFEYDLLLYDLTSTYFEGQAEKNTQAKRGYSRDKRPDCKQICIALVVTREGVPLGYEIVDGNIRDVATLQTIVKKIESRYGVAERIWVVDRGMVSKENMAFLAQPPRKYIVGTPKSMLKQFERELLAKDWTTIREGLEVKSCTLPEYGDEVFILCRSSERKAKEQAIHQRFQQRVEEGLKKLQANCDAGRVKNPSVAERRIGNLLGRNSRVARFFNVEVHRTRDEKLKIVWTIDQAKKSWAELSEGCYLLRTNLKDWSDADLWSAYMQLTHAEAAFRIQKSDLVLRPIWHQTEERVQAHILVCFLAYVLWKALGQMAKSKRLGDEPRKIVDEIGRLQLTDVILPTRDGKEIRLRCVTKPDRHQQILLQHLGLTPPSRLTQNNKM